MNDDKILKSKEENSIKTSSNELILGKSSLHDLFCKLFVEQHFDDFMALTMYVCL